MKTVMFAVVFALLGNQVVAQSTYSAATFPTYRFGLAHAGGNNVVCESRLYNTYVSAFNKCTHASNQHVGQERGRGNNISYADQKPHISACQNLMTNAYNQISGTIDSGC